MKLIVGLGNPGSEYAGTKHNVGFMVLDELGRRHRISLKKRGETSAGPGYIKTEKVVLLKPLTYMNLSGLAVSRVLRGNGLTAADLIVVHDDMDLPFGRLRLRFGGRSGGHHGIDSIIAEIGDSEFLRIKIGIGRPPEGDAARHVLTAFNLEETQALDRAILRAADAVEMVAGEGIERAMNLFNRRDDEAAAGKEGDPGRDGDGPAGGGRGER